MLSGASGVTLVGSLDDPTVLFSVDVPPGWRQGPGAYGGIGAAMVLRAMAACAGGRPVRTVSIQYCAPLPEGRHAVTVVRERVGIATTFASARLVAADRVVLHAIGTFGEDRSADLDREPARLDPAIPPADALASTPLPCPPYPEFLGRYDVRLAVGGLPYSGVDTERIGAWLRLREPEPVDPPLAVALLDAMPPAALTRTRTVRRMASVSLHAQFLRRLPDAALDPHAYAYVEVAAPATLAGYGDQHAAVYGADRRLLAVVRQLFAVV